MNAQAAVLTTSNEALVILTGVIAEAKVTPGTTEVTVKQCYTNPESIPVEAVYTFPLPLDAVLLDMRVQLGDRILSGEILPRQESENRYEDAIVDGDKAIMLQQLQAGVFTMNVGNLMPGEDCVISYRFASLNRWSGDTLRFCLPATIAPRFGDPAEIGIAPHQVPEYSMDESRGLSITVRVMDELSNAEISCPSHACKIQKGEDTTFVTLKNEAIAMDRDFILNVQAGAGANSSARIVPDRDGWLVHTSFCPKIVVGEERQSRAVKLVLDCSGSMAGDSIAQGREALLRIIDSLSPDDYFSLVRFGTSHECVFGGEKMLRVSDATIQMAKARVQMLDADMGGTNIAAAIEVALRTDGPADVPADLFLITDGNVWDHETSVRAARKSKHRIFTVGVGSAVTESYVRGLAEETGGACELVTPNEDMASKIHRHFLRMSAPRCEDMNVRFDNAPSRAFPETTGAVYDGDTVHLFHWFESAPSNNVFIDLKLADGQVMSSQIPLRAVEAQDDISDAGHDLARIAIATMIRDEVDAEAGQSLAITYQLMSKWTNYLVTDRNESAESMAQLPELRKVQSPMAAGWGGSSSMRMAEVDLIREVSCESFSMQERAKPVARLQMPMRDNGQRSDSLRTFLIDNEFDPQKDLVVAAKKLIALMQKKASLKLSIAGLPLDATIRAALNELVLQGLDESLVVSAFLHYFALGVEKGRFNRTETRMLRKRFREELASAGLEERHIGERIEDAAASLDDIGDVIAAGLAATHSGS